MITLLVVDDDGLLGFESAEVGKGGRKLSITELVEGPPRLLRERDGPDLSVSLDAS